MKVYLVRNHEQKEMQGLFWAPDFGSLTFLVDEICDPELCEYARISAGSLYTEAPFGEGPRPVQLADMPDADGSENDDGLGLNWSDFQPNETFWSTLANWNLLVWERFP